MLMILTTAEQMDAWLGVERAEAKALQRPLPDGTLAIVPRRERSRRSVAFDHFLV